MIRPHNERPPEQRGRAAGGRDASLSGLQGKYTGAPLEVFKHAHGGRFTRSGSGLRTNCLFCDDKKAALSVTERDGRLLLWCFRNGCAAADILAAVGLTFADVMPPRTWPESPEERRQARRAVREAGWSAALSTLALEAKVIAIAASDLIADKAIEWNDYCRLVAASQRIDSAAEVLTTAAQWRPEVRR
jgi:hypothetical protein